MKQFTPPFPFSAKPSTESLLTRLADEHAKQHGANPTHIFIHPKRYREIVLELANRASTVYPYRPKDELQLLCSGYSVKICMTDIRDPVDLILVGNERTYNDYIVERDLLGDHH